MCLHYGSGLAFVVYAENFLAELERAAFGSCGDGFEESHGAFAVDYAFGVEFGHAGDACIAGGLGGVEVDYFLGGFLEGEDDGVGWEGGEVGVEFLIVGINWCAFACFYIFVLTKRKWSSSTVAPMLVAKSKTSRFSHVTASGWYSWPAPGADMFAICSSDKVLSTLLSKMCKITMAER